MKEIRQAWKKSKQNPDKENSTHNEFPGEMAKRTVINRTCKTYMNTSDDGSLIMKHFQRQDEVLAEAEVEAEITANANGEVIDITPPTAAKPEPDPEQPRETTRSSKSNVEPAGQGEMDFEIHPDDIPPIGTEGPDF